MEQFQDRVPIQSEEQYYFDSEWRVMPEDLVLDCFYKMRVLSEYNDAFAYDFTIQVQDVAEDEGLHIVSYLSKVRDEIRESESYFTPTGFLLPYKQVRKREGASENGYIVGGIEGFDELDLLYTDRPNTPILIPG